MRQRELIGRDSRYVSALFSAVPAASQPAVAAAPAAPSSTGPPSSGPPSQVALSLAALATWLVTVGLGASMMARWIIRARPGRGAARNFAHMGLATASLGAWIGYLATGVVGVAWAACGLLLATASLGMTLVFLAPARDPGDAGDLAARRGTSGGRPPPALLVGVHIAAACATILLATLTAAGSA